MNVTNNISPKDFVDLPVEQLERVKSLNDQQKVAVASKQFETMFLRMVLSETQKPMIKSKFVSSSARDEIYRDFMVSNLADALSKTEPLKISSLIQQQLSKTANTSKPETE
jgi:Rod binding domain-containing protein